MGLPVVGGYGDIPPVVSFKVRRHLWRHRPQSALHQISTSPPETVTHPGTGRKRERRVGIPCTCQHSQGSSFRRRVRKQSPMTVVIALCVEKFTTVRVRAEDPAALDVVTRIESQSPCCDQLIGMGPTVYSISTVFPTTVDESPSDPSKASSNET
jgi:hypothetical protein